MTNAWKVQASGGSRGRHRGNEVSQNRNGGGLALSICGRVRLSSIGGSAYGGSTGPVESFQSRIETKTTSRPGGKVRTLCESVGKPLPTWRVSKIAEAGASK
jgi:hypothetical protein